MLEFIMPVRVAVAVDILACGACHTGTGNAAHRLTDRHLDHDDGQLDHLRHAQGAQEAD